MIRFNFILVFLACFLWTEIGFSGNTGSTKKSSIKKEVTGRTELHLAAMKGDVQAVKNLIASGADISPLDSEERTPLLLAVFNNHKAIGLLLLAEEMRKGKRPFTLKYSEKVGVTKALERTWGDLVFVFTGKQSN